MKLLKLVFFNMRRMLTKHRILSLVLIMGIIVSSCSFCIYYAQSTSMFNLRDIANATDRTVDIDVSAVGNPETLYAIRDYFSQDNFPEVGFYSIMSEENPDYDIIGICAKTVYYISPRNNSGFSAGDEAQEVIIPSKRGEIGDKFTETTKGIEFTVKDVYTEEFYEAYSYNSKRTPLSLYASSGVEKDYSEIKEGEQFNERSVYGIFMSFEDFVECGYRPGILRLRLTSPISAHQRELLINDLTNHVLSETGETVSVPETVLSTSSTVFDLQYNSQFFIYIAIVALSLINVIFIFSYILRQNRPQYLTMKSLGATNTRLIIATIFELSMYIIPSFTVGWFLAKLVIKLTYLKHSVSHIGVSEFIVLLLCIIVIAGIVCAIQLCSILKNKKTKAAEGLNIIKPKYKHAYLAAKNYTNSFFSEFIILIQVIFVAFVFTYSVTYLLERGQEERYINTVFEKAGGVPVAYFRSGDYIPFTSSPEYSIESQEWIDSVNNLEGVRDIGYVTRVKGVGIKDENENLKQVGFMVNLSPGLINNSELPLYKGRWFNETEADGLDIAVSQHIPVIISYNRHKALELNVNDTFNGVLEGTDGFYDVTYEVIGILPSDTRVYSLESIPVTMSSIVSNINNDNKADTDLFYSPLILYNGEITDSAFTSYSNLLLFADSKDRIQSWREENQKYASIYLVENLAEQSDKNFKDGSGLYEIHSFVSVALLMIGVAGYNMLSIERNKRAFGVYFSCGMPWNKSINISMTANAFLFLLGGVLGAIFGANSRANNLQLNAEIKTLSIIMTVCCILILFVLSTWRVFKQIYAIPPVGLLKKND